MKRIMLTVAYDGTAYCGWQLEPTGITVEEVLNTALSRLTGETVRVSGASRTDSGVHARGNLCVFDTETRIPPEKLCFAVNSYLPKDVAVLKSEEVALDFHPRKCDSLKTYEYTIERGSVRNPLERLYSSFCYRALDAARMNEAAAYLVGEHDFKSFCSAGAQVLTTVRRITDASVREEGSKLVIRVTGTGFLYNMVRIISGTLMEIGTGRFEPAHMREVIEAKDRAAAGPTAPPEGLCLMKIRLYPEGYPEGLLETLQSEED